MTSFNGRTGAVMPATGDYSFLQVIGSGTVPIANGGTNAITAAAARSNLGAAASGVNADITSLTGLTVALPNVAYTNGANIFGANQFINGTVYAANNIIADSDGLNSGTLLPGLAFGGGNGGTGISSNQFSGSGGNLFGIDSLYV